MDPANPIIIGLMFVLRCLVPLIIMLGISYILKRLGWIEEPSDLPAGYADDEEGELAHGKV